MSVSHVNRPKKTCNMHTKEKEKSGTCCQIKDEQENAEATYEQSFLVKTFYGIYGPEGENE